MTQSTRRTSGALLLSLLLTFILVGCTLSGSDAVPLTPFEPSGDPLPVPEEQGEQPETDPNEIDIFATQTQQAVDAEAAAPEEEGELLLPEEEESAETEGDEEVAEGEGEESPEEPTEEPTEEAEEEATEEPTVEEPTEEAPTPEEEEEAPPATAEDGREYTIQPGENLFRIAQRFGVTVEEIAAANGITNAERVSSGQTIIIPGIAPEGDANEESQQPTGPATDYTVEPGDTLYSIAINNGLTVQQLASFNDISDPNDISIGQVIRIPEN